MAFPQVADSVGGNRNGEITAHDTVALPSTVDAGDLLLLIFGTDGNPTISWPSGWTEIYNQPGDADACRLGVAYKIADGTEDGATITVTLSAVERAAWRVLRITGFDSATAPAVSTGAIGTSTTPNPDSLDPSGWATEDTLWIAAHARDSGNLALTAYPTDYTDGTDDRAENSAGVGVGAALRENAVSSEDPGAFTHDTPNQEWRAVTIAIRPATVAGPQPITHSGITSGQAFGTAIFSTDQVVTAETLASGAAFGTATFEAIAGIAHQPLASGQAFGTAEFTSEAEIEHQPLASGEAFGAADFHSEVGLSHQPLASGQAFGNATFEPGEVTIEHEPLASGEAFGNASFAAVTDEGDPEDHYPFRGSKQPGIDSSSGPASGGRR